MSSTAAPPVLQRETVDSSSVLLILLLFAGICLDAVRIPGIPVPANAVVMGLAVVIAAFMAPADSVRGRPVPLMLLLWLFPVWLVTTSLINGELDLRRIASVLLYVVLVSTLSSGRLGWVSLSRGIGLGVAVGILVGFFTMTSSSYSGRLTGPMGDPNAAGYLIVVGACLALPALKRTFLRRAFLVLVVVGLVATLSRTSWLAVALVLMWYFLGKRINRWALLVFTLFLVWASTSLPEDVLQIGVFAARAGSDSLRERISLNEEQLLAQSPWIGHGAGVTRVKVEDSEFFFHNSYMALRSEAGWIGLCLLLAVVAAVFLLLVALPNSRRQLWLEASLVAVVVCAINLGEVLLALPTALALGMSIRYVSQQRLEMQLERKSQRSADFQQGVASGTSSLPSTNR